MKATASYTPQFCEVWHKADRLDATEYYNQPPPQPHTTRQDREVLSKTTTRQDRKILSETTTSTVSNEATTTPQPLLLAQSSEGNQGTQNTTGTLPLPRAKQKEKRDCQCCSSDKAAKLYATHGYEWDAQAIWYNQALDPTSHSLDPEQHDVRRLVDCIAQSRGAGGDAERGHRGKAETSQLWNALVTKTFHAGDPITRSPEAKAALDSELKRLRDIGTWDESTVLEGSESKKLHPDGHFARIFAVYGIKHYEMDPKFHKWKARVVFGGDSTGRICNLY